MFIDFFPRFYSAKKQTNSIISNEAMDIHCRIDKFSEEISNQISDWLNRYVIIFYVCWYRDQIDF